MNASTLGAPLTAALSTEPGFEEGKAEISRRHFIQGVALAAGGASLAPKMAISAEKAGEKYDYDVVIIGSGISGAIVAKRLSELSPDATILILEAGAGGLNDRSREVSNYFSDVNKYPEAPFEDNVNAPAATIKDFLKERPAYLDHVEEKDDKGRCLTTRFGSTYLRKTGGTMWHWMGTCLRFMPNDFRTQSEYGKGRDWPISYEDLAITVRDTVDGREVSYYDMAEDEIGVSAHVDDQDPPTRKGGKVGLFRDGREYPMPALASTIIDEFFKKGVKGMTFEGEPVWVYRTPAGRNSVPYKNRPACAGNSSCVPICRIKAKYDATVTLDDLIRHHGKRVTLQTQCIVTKLEFNAANKITGVNYVSYSDPSRVSPQAAKHVTGKIYVLAANGIESPKLMLASGMGEINDSIGRNLMDHPFFLRQGLVLPRKNEPYRTYPYRGPLSTGGLDGMRDGKFRAKRAAWRIEIGNDGWALSGEDPWRTVSKFVDMGWYGEKLVKHLNDIFTRQCRIGFELEQLPDRENRVTLTVDKDAPEILRFRPKVRYSYSDYEKEGFRSALKFTRKLFQRLEIEDASPDREDLNFNFMDPGAVMGAGHVMGTCCMGTDPKTSVVDRNQRSHDFKNLFVVGSSVFTTGGTANPTLTLAALAFWAADTIHRELA